MERIRSSIRWVVVTVGIIVLTSFTVDATLSPSGFSQSALGILASKTVPAPECGEGMVLVQSSDKKLCVDKYEASPNVACAVQIIQSVIDTRANNENASCIPTSVSGVSPWVFVTYHQAKELCAKAGKRLPTSEEWYTFALGTPDTALCNTSTGKLRDADADGVCTNAFGVHDAIGNAWEWVDGVVTNGVYSDKVLPESGYVVSADASGVASVTHPLEASADFHDDYFWSEKTGEFGMARGGFYASESDAGLYSVQAKIALTLASDAIGFRCVSTLQ